MSICTRCEDMFSSVESACNILVNMIKYFLLISIVEGFLMLYYCKKCGRIIFLFDSWEKVCDCCKVDVYPVPEQYLSSEFSINEDLKENFVNEYIKSSSEFDQHLYEKRENNAIQHADDFVKYNLALEHGKSVLEGRDKGNQFGVECPYCHSKDTKKITTTSKVVNTAVWGIFGTKRHKQWHCNNCNSDF